MLQTSRPNCPSLNELLNIDRLPDSDKDRHSIVLNGCFRPKAAVDLLCLSRREAVVAEVAKPPKLLRFAKVSKATMPSPSRTSKSIWH